MRRVTGGLGHGPLGAASATYSVGFGLTLHKVWLEGSSISSSLHPSLFFLPLACTFLDPFSVCDHPGEIEKIPKPPQTRAHGVPT